MSSSMATQFLQILESALRHKARISPEELKTLEQAAQSIQGVQRQSAHDIVAMLRHDREFDAFEVGPMKQAVGVLLGADDEVLDHALKETWRRAIPGANVSIKHYSLEFDFSKNVNTSGARAVISLDAPAPARTVLEANEERLTILDVVADGRSVPFQVVEGRLYVDAPGVEKFDIRYLVKAMTPANQSYGLIRDPQSGRVWSNTQPEYTGSLFPSNSAPSDGSTSTVRIRVPAGWSAIASGQKRGTAFVTAAPSPAYAIGVYAANGFQQSEVERSEDGVSVAVYGLGNRVPEKARERYRDAGRSALDFFSEWLGDYDYGSSLNFVEVEGGLRGKALEHTSAVAMSWFTAQDVDDATETAVHEVAHHWFGNNLRMKTWGDVWLSEGFANYATYRYLRHVQGEGAYRQQSVGTEDFVRFASAHTGHDFRAFFSAWNDLTVVPSFRADVSIAGEKVQVKIEARNAFPSSLRLPLELWGERGDRLVVMIDPSEPQIELTPGFRVSTAKWDPDRQVLAYVNRAAD